MTRAKLESCEISGNLVRTAFFVEDVPGPPVAPAYVREDERKVIMELHRLVARAGNTLTFETEGFSVCPLTAGQVYLIGSQLTTAQLEIAQSDPVKWRWQSFQASDSVAYLNDKGAVVSTKAGPDVPEGGQVIKGGWEHEHCSLCWKEISEIHEGDRSGYTDGKHWLCQECFDEYVKSGLGKRIGDFA